MKKFEIWLADLNPRFGTEPEKIRPIVIVQSDLLNQINHPSTVILPITSKTVPNAFPLRLHLDPKKYNLDQESDIIADQIRSIDNKRFIKKIDTLNNSDIIKLQDALKKILDLDSD